VAELGGRDEVQLRAHTTRTMTTEPLR
jgi:hypothetical protein